MLAKLTLQIKAQHGKRPAELTTTVNRDTYGYFYFILFYLLTLEHYVEMAKSSSLKVEITGVQGSCALRLHCCTESDPRAS